MKKKSGSTSQDPVVVLKNIGLKLRELRKAKGYTNSEDFSYDIPMNRSQYGKYETGKGKPDLQISTLVRIVNALGLTIEEFFNEGLDPK